MLYQQKNSVGTYFFEMIRYENFLFGPHMHRHFEIIYVREGVAITELFHRKEIVTAGQMAFIPSNCLHAYATPEHSVVDVCIFSADYVPVFAQTIRRKQATTVAFTCRDTVTEFARREVFVTEHTPELYTIKAALYAIAGEIWGSIQFQDASEKQEILLYSVVQYISEHFTENITLSSTATALGYEPHYLSRCFHRWIPMHFSKYVNLFRIDAAIELLRSSQRSMLDIALDSGFMQPNFQPCFLGDYRPTAIRLSTAGQRHRGRWRIEHRQRKRSTITKSKCNCPSGRSDR